MGQAESLTTPDPLSPLSTDSDILYAYVQMNKAMALERPSNLKKVTTPNRSVNSAVLSVTSPSVSPSSRTGFFCVCPEPCDFAYIGYGFRDDETFLNDLWSLNMRTLEWVQIPLFGDPITPRTGSRAVFYDGLLIVFGGYSSNDYIAQLHTIDVKTGEVKMIETTGRGPTPRIGPLVHFWNGCFYLWGGFNGRWPNELYSLNWETKEWTSVEIGLNGRALIPFVHIGCHIYGYGCCKSGGFVSIDLKEKTGSVARTDGIIPPPGILASGAVQISDFIFFFGGVHKGLYSPIYVYSLKEKRWFLMPVLANQEEVECLFDDMGIAHFLSLQSFGAIYDPRKRRIVVVLGSPNVSSAQYVLSVGNFLSSAHLSNDMLSSLRGSKHCI